VEREHLLDEHPERREPLGLGFSLSRLDDQDMRQVGSIRIGLMAFEPVEDRHRADPVGAPADLPEAAGAERLFEQTAIPEKAMAPGLEAAVDLQGRAHPASGSKARAVESGQNPFKVRGREPQPTAIAQSPVGLAEEVERLLDREMLQEVLGEHGAAARELETLGHVGDQIHPGEILGVDVDPAFEAFAATAHVKQRSRSILRFGHAGGV